MLTVLLVGGTTVIYQLPKLRLLSPVLLTRRAGQMFPFSLVTDRLSDGNCECLQGCREGGGEANFLSFSELERETKNKIMKKFFLTQATSRKKTREKQRLSASLTGGRRRSSSS